VVASPGSPPRPYDLRHAHVVEVINRWARAGRDPEAQIAYLSLQLGHSNPDDTWYYFHLAADFHPELRRLANTDLEAILPEASHEIR
ncbi:MAG TPA: integrase, partial [Arthrobacter bacterium]|nr:integrase [Arthrobacter sp.]